MQIVINTGGLASTNAYLIADEVTKKAVIVDAPDHTVGTLVEEAARRGYDLIGLWLTHGHFDHIADHKVVTDRFPNARVLIHALDHPKLQDPRAAMFPLPFVIPPRHADQLIEDGESLTIGTLKARVLHTPGHSPGHVAFHFPDEGILVSGDLVMMGSVGRTDLPDSDPGQLMQSLVKVMQLPPETKLLSGHGEASTVADELQHNPYVRQALQRKSNA